MLRGRRIKKNSCRLLRLRTQDYRSRRHFMRLMRISIYVKHAARAIAVGVHQDLVCHRIRNERAVASDQGIRDRCKCGVEIRMCDASPFARPTKVAGPAAVEWPREIGRPSQRHRPAEFLFHAIAKESFVTREWHGRLELA